MITYSQHDLDAKIATFMKKKMHQFPALRNERHYIERIDKIEPVERHRDSHKSGLFPTPHHRATA